MLEVSGISVGRFTDPRDEQIYKTVIIGEQEWFAQNLNFKKGHSSCYDHHGSNCEKYGRLYTWNSAQTACPDGWHLPTDDEWKQLEMLLGMNQYNADADGWRGGYEGWLLKSKDGWDGEETIDSAGFSALPGGFHQDDWDFSEIGKSAYWWTATENDPFTYMAWYRKLELQKDKIYRFFDRKEQGYSIRCVKD